MMVARNHEIGGQRAVIDVVFFFQAEDGIRDLTVTGVQTCALPILVLRGIRGASRDKSTVIFVLFLAAVLFWMAFEQAGNTLNIWAITHTDLRIGSFE